jgi:hypothetical protein
MIVVAPVHYEEFRTWCAGVTRRTLSHDRSGEIVWDRGASDVATKRTGECAVADGAVRSVKIDKTGRHDQVNQLAVEDSKRGPKCTANTEQLIPPSLHFVRSESCP